MLSRTLKNLTYQKMSSAIYKPAQRSLPCVNENRLSETHNVEAKERVIE